MRVINDGEHIERLARHIRLVQDAGLMMYRKLHLGCESPLGLKILRACIQHDSSKLQNSSEWEYLRRGADEEYPTAFKMALSYHQHSNKHHPEYWGDINKIPDEYLAEMVCDWYARSCEHGTDFRKWIGGDYKKRFDADDKTDEKIKKFAGLLIEKPMPSFSQED